MLKVGNEKEISRSVNHKFCLDDICTVGCATSRRAKVISWVFCQLSTRLIYRLKSREVFRDEIHEDSVIFGLNCGNGCIFECMNGSFCTWIIFALVASDVYHVCESYHTICICKK